MNVDERHPPQEPECDVEAIVLNRNEQGVWRALSSLLDEPIGVCFRLCALSGAEHYLAELGREDEAAVAGALLRLYAESKGIEIQATEARPSDARMGHKRSTRRG